MPLQTGDQLPKDIVYSYIPIDLHNLNVLDPLTCGRPINLNVDQLFDKLNGKSLVIVAAPGAFTPTCTENHIPPILSNLKKLSERGVGAVVFITSNDAFVNNAWGKLLINQAKFDHKDIPSFPQIYFASDDDVKFSAANAVAIADNKRTGRYALVIDGDRTVKYAGYEKDTGLSVSGIDNILDAKF